MTKDPFGTQSNAASCTFPKSRRILRSREFREVYDKGFRVSVGLWVAVCLARPSGEGPRLGLAVPRALGGSVERNRIRRRLREVFRRHRCEFSPQWDIVLHPRRAVLDAPFAGLERDLEKVIARCRN